MAYIVPSDVSQLALAGAHAPELETLALLKRRLPSAYTVFHGVHWTREYRGHTVFGEIDFVVINRAGDILLIEQKNGLLEEGEGGLEKRYGKYARNVPDQLRRSVENVRAKFYWVHGRERAPSIDYLLYCPDHKIVNINAVGIDGSRVVDGDAGSPLAEKIEELLTEGQPDETWHEKIEDFFCQTFDLRPDVHAHTRSGEKAFARLSGGLAGVLANIEMQPLRLRVKGAPGCGKTVVAQAFFENAVANGRRPLLLCFNRPLAEKLKAVCPKGGYVDTWYGLCTKFLEARGEKIDFSKMQSDPQFWENLQDRVVSAEVDDGWKFDTIIVDEGQDFQQTWVEILELFWRDEPNLLWLEDQDQGIRAERQVELKGFVGYRARSNYRSPETIARFIQKVSPFEFEPANELPGLGVGVHAYDSSDNQPKIVGRLVADLLRRGFDASDIVILTLRGFGNSVFSERERVGNNTLKRFTGDYDLLGNQRFTDGQVRFESIYRFKGQQTPAVIVVDIETRENDTSLTEKLLYSAMTRATVRLDLVVRGEDPLCEPLKNASW